MNKLMQKHNDKLRDKGIEYVAITYPTGVKSPQSMYLCPQGHEFSADRARMMRGVTKCPSCASPGAGRTRTHLGYENTLNELEIDLYPVEKYAGSNIAIDHMCLHGHVTKKTPASVLRGSGCAKCSGVAKLTHEEYYDRLTKINPDVVPVRQYDGQGKKLRHLCKVCDTKWDVKPHDLLNGTGCPSCAAFGFNRAKSGTLYYVKLWDESKTYYKIGVTNGTVERRFRSCGKQYKILLERKYDLGREAEAAEKMILEEYKESKALAPRWLKTGGNTELFKHDVLLLDVDSVA